MNRLGVTVAQVRRVGVHLEFHFLNRKPPLEKKSCNSSCILIAPSTESASIAMNRRTACDRDSPRGLVPDFFGRGSINVPSSKRV